jgi:hypothetical protein
MIMLDYYNLQKTLTALSNDKHTYTAPDIATLCKAGKLTPLFSYNRYVAEKIEILHGNTGEYYEDFSPYTIASYKGYLTNHQLLDLLDGYSDSIPLKYAYNDKGHELQLVANDVVLDRLTNENYSPYSDDDALTVTREQIFFKREEVELLAEQPQTSQRNRSQTDETNTDKKLIAMMAVLLAKQSNTFRISGRPNATRISEHVYNLAKELGIDKEDMIGLKANTNKISTAVQAHADMFKLSKD